MYSKKFRKKKGTFIKMCRPLTSALIKQTKLNPSSKKKNKKNPRKAWNGKMHGKI